MNVAKWRSDYAPDTVLTLVQTDDGDIVLRIHGKGEMRFATSGGKLHGQDLATVTSAFADIIRVLQKHANEN